VSPRPLTARRYVLSLLVWAAVWLVLAAVAVLFGSQNIWAWESPAARSDILEMRIYGVLLASAVGGALAASGLAFQALLRNPLASPYILGVSGGASFGVIAAGVAGLAVTVQPIAGFAGALVTVFLVYAVAQRRGRIEPYTLLLSGVILNAFYAAGIMLIIALVDPESRGEIAYWMMGNIDVFDVHWERAGVMVALAVGAAGVLAFLAKGFNLVAVGEDAAGALGVRVDRLRLTAFVVASLVTGAAVAFAGPIGFLGLIVPHMLRMVLGPDHRRLVPASLFAGAAFLVLADLATRLLQGAAVQLSPPPVGVLTALCGGPFFIYLLRTRWRRSVEIR
jgi:iron complex transport system permease protein